MVLLIIHMEQTQHIFSRFCHFFISTDCHLMADHQICKLCPICILFIHCSNSLTSPQDRHPVTDCHYLTHFVGDKNNGFIFCCQPSHNSEKSFYFLVGQCRRGFIQDQQFRATVERLQYFHSLLLTYGDLIYLFVQIYFQPIFL